MKSALPVDLRAGSGLMSATGSQFAMRRSGSRAMWAGRAVAVIGAVAATFLAAAPAAAQDPGAAEAAPPPVVIDSVIVRGLVRQPEAVVRAEIGIRSGDTITIRTVQRAQRRLWASGNYRDIQVRIVEPEGQPGAPVQIIFELAEQPFISEIVFEGLENVRPSVVRDTVGLRARTPYQPARAVEAEAMIRKMLSEKGIRVAQLSHRVEEIPDRPGEYRLRFDVAEGHRVSIARIDFEGNTVFSDERLRKVIDTKAEGFFWFRGGEFDEEKLRAGMLAALQKRPVKTEDVEASIERIRHRLQTMGERDVPSRRIGDMVMEELRRLDEVAYVRFASIYRSFQDVTEFQEEIQRLRAQPHKSREQMSLLPEDDEP